MKNLWGFAILIGLSTLVLVSAGNFDKVQNIFSFARPIDDITEIQQQKKQEQKKTTEVKPHYTQVDDSLPTVQEKKEAAVRKKERDEAPAVVQNTANQAASNPQTGQQSNPVNNQAGQPSNQTSIDNLSNASKRVLAEESADDAGKRCWGSCILSGGEQSSCSEAARGCFSGQEKKLYAIAGGDPQATKLVSGAHELAATTNRLQDLTACADGAGNAFKGDEAKMCFSPEVTEFFKNEENRKAAAAALCFSKSGCNSKSPDFVKEINQAAITYANEKLKGPSGRPAPAGVIKDQDLAPISEIIDVCKKDVVPKERNGEYFDCKNKKKITKAEFDALVTARTRNELAKVCVNEALLRQQTSQLTSSAIDSCVDGKLAILKANPNANVFVERVVVSQNITCDGTSWIKNSVKYSTGEVQTYRFGCAPGLKCVQGECQKTEIATSLTSVEVYCRGIGFGGETGRAACIKRLNDGERQGNKYVLVEEKNGKVKQVDPQSYDPLTGYIAIAPEQVRSRCGKNSYFYDNLGQYYDCGSGQVFVADQQKRIKESNDNSSALCKGKQINCQLTYVKVIADGGVVNIKNGQPEVFNKNNVKLVFDGTKWDVPKVSASGAAQEVENSIKDLRAEAKTKIGQTQVPEWMIVKAVAEAYMEKRKNEVCSRGQSDDPGGVIIFCAVKKGETTGKWTGICEPGTKIFSLEHKKVLSCGDDYKLHDTLQQDPKIISEYENSEKELIKVRNEFGVEVRNMQQYWTPEKITELRSLLSDLPKEFYQGAIIMGNFGPGWTLAGGFYSPGRNDGESVFVSQTFDKLQTVSDKRRFRETILHELVHRQDNKNKLSTGVHLSDSQAFITAANNSGITFNPDGSYDSAGLAKIKELNETVGQGDRFDCSTSHRVELLSCVGSMFYLNGDGLKKAAPELYDFARSNIFGNRPVGAVNIQAFSSTLPKTNPAITNNPAPQKLGITVSASKPTEYSLSSEAIDNLGIIDGISTVTCSKYRHCIQKNIMFSKVLSESAGISGIEGDKSYKGGKSPSTGFFQFQQTAGESAAKEARALYAGETKESYIASGGKEKDWPAFSEALQIINAGNINKQTLANPWVNGILGNVVYNKKANEYCEQFSDCNPIDAANYAWIYASKPVIHEYCKDYISGQWTQDMVGQCVNSYSNVGFAKSTGTSLTNIDGIRQYFDLHPEIVAEIEASGQRVGFFQRMADTVRGVFNL